MQYYNHLKLLAVVFILSYRRIYPNIPIYLPFTYFNTYLRNTNNLKKKIIENYRNKNVLSDFLSWYEERTS